MLVKGFVTLQRKECPTKKWLKPALKEWLVKHAATKQIEFDPKKEYLKDQLWDLIKPTIGMSKDNQKWHTNIVCTFFIHCVFRATR